MFTVTHVLSPEMVKALAAEFKDLDPKPLGDAPRELAAAGKRIYEEGIPSANVPPCANCHGADAKGNGPFPRLAGQLDDYILRKLVNWSQERGQGTSRHIGPDGADCPRSERVANQGRRGLPLQSGVGLALDEAEI